MNLSQIIHQRWAVATGLNDLLPAARVATGLSVDPTTPYAVISKEGQASESLHHDGSGVDEVKLRIQVYHDHYDEALAIVEQIDAAFHRTSFDLAGGDRVLFMQRTGDFENQNDDGLWRFVVDFRLAVYLAPGDS
jgi:hypothetical protein